MLAMVKKMRSRTNVFIDVCETKFTMMILKRKAVASPYMLKVIEKKDKNYFRDLKKIMIRSN